MNKGKAAAVGIAGAVAALIVAEEVVDIVAAQKLAEQGIKLRWERTAPYSEAIYITMLDVARNPVPLCNIQLQIQWVNAKGGWMGANTRATAITNSLGQAQINCAAVDKTPLPAFTGAVRQGWKLYAYTSTKPTRFNQVEITFRDGYSLYVEMEVR